MAIELLIRREPFAVQGDKLIRIDGRLRGAAESPALAPAGPAIRELSQGRAGLPRAGY
jgi:hypothetical protein